MESTPDRLRRLSDLLDQALDRPESEWEGFLRGLQGEAAELSPTLRAMLARHAARETGDLLDRLPLFAPPDAAADACVFAPGDRVGPYKLERELGRGGMGEVWLAERTDGQLRRQVALKLPMLAARRGVLVQRFARERDILASLAHPHIARLYDAGLADDGQPYLALEYVVGEPVTDYCNEHRLDARARVALVRQVMDAVQYAHAHLVIHRDLKPGNVLVTHEGEAMLLDFGIAKLLDDDGSPSQETELTKLGGRALTLGYAAPEQVTGGAISIATDVYAIGVLLYELLAGRRPFSADSRTALEQAVLTAEPQRPSQVAGSPIAALPRSLAADLDTIVLKALKKAPAERYATVNAFADDLERFSRGEAVRARPDSRWYRTRKFVARNRLAVGASAAVTAIVVAASAFSFWQAQVARQQALAAQEAAARERKEAERAQAVQDFLLDIFRTSSTLQKDALKAQRTTARELLDIGAKRISEAMKDAPEGRIKVLHTLADMYHGIGLRGEARRLLGEATDLARSTYGRLDPRFAEIAVGYAFTLSETDERARMPALFEEANAALLASNRGDTLLRGQLLYQLSLYQRYESLGKAIEAADAALAVLTHHPKEILRIDALRGAGRTRMLSGDLVKAERLFREAVAATQSIDGADGWQVNARSELAEPLFRLLRLDEAEREGRASVQAATQNFGAEHRWTLVVRVRLANLLTRIGLREEGERIRAEIAQTLKNGRGEYDAQFRADMAGYMGGTLLERGRPDLSEPLISEDLSDLRRVIPNSGAVARREVDLAEIWTSLGRYDEARALIETATTHWNRFSVGAAAPYTLNEYTLPAVRVSLATGAPQEAAARIARVVRAAPSASGVLVHDDVLVATERARVALALGEAGRARDEAQAGLDALRHQVGPERLPHRQASLMLVLGQAHRALGDLPGAERELGAALALRRRHDDPQSLWLAQVQIALADCLAAQGRREAARALREEAQGIHARHARVAPHLAASR